MEIVNAFITKVFSLALSPLASINPFWGLTLVSVVAGVILVVVYGKVSNQAGLKRVKKGISAGIFESVIFRNDIRTCLKAQAGMLLGGCRYVGLAVPPLLILLIPSLFILAQLNARYGARALQPGESTIVSVAIPDEDALFETTLSAPKGFAVTPPLRDLDAQTVTWRVDVPASLATTGKTTLTVSINGAKSDYPLYIGEQPTVLPTESHTSAWWQVLYPGADFPATLKQYAQSISITYPEQVVALGGVSMHWLVLFAVVSIVAGLIGSKIIGIEI